MGLLSTVVLAGFQPRRTAQKAKDAALWRVYVLHWAGLAFGFVLLLLAGSLSSTFLADLESFLHELGAEPAALAFALSVVASIEAFFLLIAFMLMPWVSADARPRQAWGHALRTVWLHTGQLMLSLFPFAVALFFDWAYVWRYRPRWSFEEPEVQAGFLNVLAFYFPYALPFVLAAGIVWCLWALFRAGAADMGRPAADRPPQCEACGYNLTYHTQDEARCPECGQPAGISFDPRHRSPINWWPPRTKHGRVGFWKATWRAWFSPEAFFARLSGYSGLKDAGTFLLVQMFLAAAAFTVGLAVPMRVLVFNSSSGFADLIHAAIWGGGFLGLAAGGLSCLVAAIYGLNISRQDGINKMGICLRSACYCAGIYPLWFSTTMAAFVICVDMIDNISGANRYGEAAYLGFLGVHVLYLVTYVGGVVRRTRHLRYANY